MKNFKLLQVLALLLAFAMPLAMVACNGGSEEGEDAEGSSIEESGSSAAESEEESGETNLELGDEIEYAASFTVSKVFSSNMVIQRNEYVRVWGFADESENGKKVSATFMGKKADALIENGEWELVFNQTFDANKELGNDLVVYSESADNVSYVFEDILIGDVFMVIGQSNVQYSISEYLAAESELKWTKELLSSDSIIRFNYNSNKQTEGYPVQGTAEVCKDAINGYGWVIPDENNIDELSAIGYFIAKQIADLTENGIPVGISQFSAGGRPLSVFMPNELAEELGSDHFDEALGIYKGNYHESVVARYMYNHYINPFERMPIAGIVWYQGEAESNPALSTVYVERFTALMEYMRSTHNLVNKEFPVFYVEFPSVYRVEGSTQYLDTGRIRAESGMIPLSLSNSYIAVCSDLWDEETNTNNIHPFCKYEQAERVVALMDTVIYGGRTMEEAAGPILDSYELSEDRRTMTIKFKNVGDGLATSDGGTVVNGFSALYKNNAVQNRIVVNAEITDKDTVTITSSKPFFGVAYNCVARNFFGEEINLCDSDGHPAHAFWIFIE